MIHFKLNIETACSCEIYGFISLFPIIPRSEHDRKQFLSVFPMCRALSVLLGQDYMAKRKIWILRTCGNQRKQHHCINPWCSHISNTACQYFFRLGIPEDTYFMCINTHTYIYNRHTHKHYTGEQCGRPKAWRTSQVRLHNSRPNLKIIGKTKKLDDTE